MERYPTSHLLAPRAIPWATRLDWLAKLEGEGRKASGSSDVLWKANVQFSCSGDILFQLGKAV